MCPIPQLRLVGVRTSYIYFSNISWTPSSGPHYKSLFWGALAAPCYMLASNTVALRLAVQGLSRTRLLAHAHAKGLRFTVLYVG